MNSLRCHLKLLLLVGMFVSFTSCECQEVYEAHTLELMTLDTNPDLVSEYIVVIGDIQEYTNNMFLMSYYESTIQWIYSQYMQGMDIKCVLQTGDLTATNLPAQYQSFYNVTSTLTNFLPFVACIGNHDYNWNESSKIIDRNSTLFSQYTHFQLTDSLTVARFEDGKTENIVVKNYIGGQPYYILSLEFGPREEVLAWAEAYVTAHPELNFILMTHEFLTSKGRLIGEDSYAIRQFRNTTCSSPEQIWNRLVKKYNNIICVLCGHNGFYAYLESENELGRKVPQLLFNLQYQKNGGDGMIELWEFPLYQDTAIVRIYNTITREWYREKEDIVEYKFRYKWN